MRIRACASLCVCAVSVWLVLSSVGSFSVQAAGTSRTLTPAETRSLLGDTLNAKYYDGSDYVDFTFSYGGTSSIRRYYSTSTGALAAGDTVIWYSAQVSPNTNPQFITVDVRPQYSIIDTDSIVQTCGCSLANYPATSAYSPPSWRWHDSVSGDVIVENRGATANGTYESLSMNINNVERWFTYIDVDLSYQSTFSAYSDRALFYGNNAVSGTMYFFVSCPTVADNADIVTGTDIGSGGGSGGSGGDVNVTVDVDMTETNGILDGILDVLGGIVDAIAGIFIPDDDYMLDWLDDMHDMLREHFGSFVDAMAIIDEVFDTVHEDEAAGSIDGVQVSSATIGLPTDFTVSSYGVDFTLSASDWQMPLVPSGFAFIVGLFVDFQRIIYLIMFVNMLNNKLHHYLSPQDGT